MSSQFKATFILILFFIFSCQNKTVKENTNFVVQNEAKSTHIESTIVETTTASTPQRSPAYATFVQDHTNKHIKLFNEIMNSKNDNERLNKFKNLVDRQISIYYFVTHKIKNFDSLISELHSKKQSQGKIDKTDKKALEKAHIENNLLWEFKEKNMDELLKLYNIALVNAHDDSSVHQRESKWILAKIPFWLRASWNKDADQLPVIEIAEKLQIVSSDFKRKSAKYNPNYLPELNTFLKLTVDQYNDSIKKTDDNYNLKFKNGSNELINTSWNEYLSKLEDEDVIKNLTEDEYQVSGEHFILGQWSLSFSGGPDINTTNLLYENLKTTATPATFFWTGQNLQKHNTLIKNQKDLTVTKAISTYSHSTLFEMDRSLITKEVNRSIDDFVKVTGEQPTLFRCPYANCGDIESDAVRLIQSKKMIMISWNVDTFDWHDRNPELIYERTKKQIELHEGGIISFQETNAQTPIVAKKIIHFLKSKYKIEPLTKLVEESKK